METPSSIPTQTGAPKKNGCLKGMLFGGCGVLLFVALAVVLFVVIGSRQVGKLEEAASPFLSKIQAGELQDAYGSASPEYRSKASYDEFRQFAEKQNLEGYSSVDFSYASAGEADEEALEARVVTKEGNEVRLLVTLQEAGDGHSVTGLTKAPEKPEPSSKTTVETWAKKEKKSKSGSWSWSTAKIENLRFETEPLPGSAPPAFPADIQRIVITAELENSPPDTEVTSYYIYKGTEGEGDRIIDKSLLTVDSSGSMTFTVDRHDPVLAVGNWVFRILIDGNLKEEVPFRVVLDLEDLTRKAEEGDANAQLAVGLAYRRHIIGYEGPLDEAKGAVYIEKSANQGDRRAQYYAGEIYLGGIGVAENPEAGVSWIKKSAGQGYAQAQRALGEIYQLGDGVKQDLDQAEFWLKKAADQGHAEGTMLLGKLYLNYGDEAKKEEGAALVRKAEEAGNPEAQLILGQMYERGIFVEKDVSAARKLYEKAAASGIPDAVEALQRLDASPIPKEEEQ